MIMDYYALTFYHLMPLESLEAWVKDHKNYFKNTSLVGRIYIAKEGINAQMSGPKGEIDAYIQWLSQKEGCASIGFKKTEENRTLFAKMTVKVKKQLVAIDVPVDLDLRGSLMSPEEWDKTLSGEKDYILIDVRNHYESLIGHFEGAEKPSCETFREFR